MAAGIGATVFYEKGGEYEITDLSLLSQVRADLGWAPADPEATETRAAWLESLNPAPPTPLVAGPAPPTFTFEPAGLANPPEEPEPDEATDPPEASE